MGQSGLSNAIQPIFAGYYPKSLFDPGWPDIRWVCSVSICISEGPDFTKEASWDFNQAKFYDTVRAAEAAGAEGATIFAYWIYPVHFRFEENTELVPLTSNWKDLPTRSPVDDWVTIGFDLAVHEPELAHWGCSPLTCRGACPEATNPYGLVDSVEKAFELAPRLGPESGPMMVIQVQARTADLAKLVLDCAPVTST